VGVRIAASILSADFGDLAGAVAQAESAGVEAIHIDVMDGHYVRNLTFGPKTVLDLRRRTALPLHVHLEIARPADFIGEFAGAGANMIIVQEDTCADIPACLDAIRAAGAAPGLCLNPGRPFAAVAPYLARVDLLLFLSVHPGFGGQAFQASVLEKVREARQAMVGLVHPPLIGMDGGINPATVRACVVAGAELLAAGSAIFAGGASIADNVRALRDRGQ
jgi:ribulose-phosphate 3-epimerase